MSKSKSIRLAGAAMPDIKAELRSHARTANAQSSLHSLLEVSCESLRSLPADFDLLHEMTSLWCALYTDSCNLQLSSLILLVMQGSASIEAFFGRTERGTRLTVERKATLFPPFTLGASLQQSIARSTIGTDRCAVAQTSS
jgi:hypothetical protein